MDTPLAAQERNHVPFFFRAAVELGEGSAVSFAFDWDFSLIHLVRSADMLVSCDMASCRRSSSVSSDNEKF